MLNRLAVFVMCALCLPAQVTVLSHVTVIDGTGRDPIRDAGVLIANGLIAAIGRLSDIRIPAGSQVVDYSGKTIIPGIINLHAHIGEDPAPQLRTLARYGVTSVVGLGGDGDEVLKIRSAQKHGDVSSARIYTVQQRFEFEKDAPTPADARAKVDALYRKGVDGVKIVVDNRRNTVAKLKPEICLAVIDQAHRHHLKVFAHIFEYSDAKFLMDHGVDILAHQVRDREVDDAFLSEMKARKIPVTSTLSGTQSFYIYADSPAWLEDPFFLKWAPPKRVLQAKTGLKEAEAKDPAAAFFRHDFEIAARNLKKMSDAGIRIGFGNDDDGHSPTRFEGFWEHLEMELMVKYGGLTPSQVIQAFSKTNSEALGIDKNFGTLAKGKAADLVVLDKNPLDDILNTRTIRAVYIAGKEIDLTHP
jgi:imidazolonepropionase-like amidohydrolase